MRRIDFRPSTVLTLLALLVFAAPLFAQASPDPGQLRLVEIARGFSRPLYVTHAGDGSGRLFVVEQAGRIWVVRDGFIQPEPFLDIGNWLPWEVHTSGFTERGLLGLAFHPQLRRERLFLPPLQRRARRYGASAPAGER